MPKETANNVGRMRRHELIYTSHQVMNKIANDVFSGSVMFALYLDMVVLIIATFIVIKLSYRNYLTLVIGTCAIIPIHVFAVKHALSFAASCYTNSEPCYTIGRAGRRKESALFWKSRKPISIMVGDAFALETRTYVLVVFGDIILQNVISLLVTF